MGLKPFLDEKTPLNIIESIKVFNESLISNTFPFKGNKICFVLKIETNKIHEFNWFIRNGCEFPEDEKLWITTSNGT